MFIMDCFSSAYAYIIIQQSLANDIQPHIGITQPADLNWYQQKEKKLKELRSKLRHKMADLDDLREVCNIAVSVFSN